MKRRTDYSKQEKCKIYVEIYLCCVIISYTHNPVNKQEFQKLTLRMKMKW